MRDTEWTPNIYTEVCYGKDGDSSIWLPISLAWLDPSLPARECNCDGRVRKRGGEHTSITKSDQSDSTGRNADSWISSIQV